MGNGEVALSGRWLLSTANPPALGLTATAPAAAAPAAPAAVEGATEVLMRNRDIEECACPTGVMRCRRELAFKAGESGRYRARAVRMNV